jgi:hypothetical protein
MPASPFGCYAAKWKACASQDRDKKNSNATATHEEIIFI